MDVAFCKVCRYRPEEGDFVVEAAVGWKQDVVGRIVSTADESTPQGRAFVTGLPVICGDLDKDPVFLMPSYFLEHGIVSTLSVLSRAMASLMRCWKSTAPYAMTMTAMTSPF